MQLIRDLDAFPDDLRGGVASIGNFDGVHRGHARIVGRLVQRARRGGVPSVVFTFDPHPVAVLRPDAAPPPLTWPERKAMLLGELGVDAVVAYPTDEALLSLAPHEFFAQIVSQRLAASGLVEGPNFFFGRGRSGTVRLLGEFCHRARITLDVLDPLIDDGEIVSSSRVRGLLRTGDIAHARRLLTRPYRIRGQVVRGAARGASLGFPTANLHGIDTLLPAAGVYAGRALVAGTMWPTALHLGPLPTFGLSSPVVEAHLIGFSGDLYGQRLEVEFLERLREVRRFSDVSALREQLAADVVRASQVVAALSDDVSAL